MVCFSIHMSFIVFPMSSHVFLSIISAIFQVFSNLHSDVERGVNSTDNAASPSLMEIVRMKQQYRLVIASIFVLLQFLSFVNPATPYLHRHQVSSASINVCALISFWGDLRLGRSKK